VVLGGFGHRTRNEIRTCYLQKSESWTPPDVENCCTKARAVGKIGCKIERERTIGACVDFNERTGCIEVCHSANHTRSLRYKTSDFHSGLFLCIGLGYMCQASL